MICGFLEFAVTLGVNGYGPAETEGRAEAIADGRLVEDVMLVTALTYLKILQAQSAPITMLISQGM